MSNGGNGRQKVLQGPQYDGLMYTTAFMLVVLGVPGGGLVDVGVILESNTILAKSVGTQAHSCHALNLRLDAAECLCT